MSKQAFEQETHKMRYTTVTLEGAIESSSLLSCSRAQLSVPIVLMRALHLNKDENANIYIDSQTRIVPVLLYMLMPLFGRKGTFSQSIDLLLSITRRLAGHCLQIFFLPEVEITYYKGHQKGIANTTPLIHLSGYVAPE